MERVFVPNTSTSLQATLAADAHLAEGEFPLEEKSLNAETSVIYRVATRKPTVSETEGQSLEPS
jgi:hypothetical protein